MSEINNIIEHYYTSGYIRKVLSYFFRYYALPLELLPDYEQSICIELLSDKTSKYLINISKKESASKELEIFIYRIIKNTILEDVFGAKISDLSYKSKRLEFTEVDKKHNYLDYIDIPRSKKWYGKVKSYKYTDMEREYLTDSDNEYQGLDKLRNEMRHLNRIDRIYLLTYIELGSVRACIRRFKCSFKFIHSNLIRILKLLDEKVPGINNELLNTLKKNGNIK